MGKEFNGYKLGWLPDCPDGRDLLYKKVGFFKAIQLPKLVDLRDKCPPVYNQGSLSSCTGQGVGASHQFIQMKQNIPDMFVPSKLFLYFGAREIEGTINQDCGAMIRDVIKVAVRQGVCDENKWPYDVKKFAIRPPDECYRGAKKHTVASYERLDNTQINQLKGCLAEGYPFVFGSMLYKSFMSDEVTRTGKVPMPLPDEEAVGGHAMCVVPDTYITTSTGPKKIIDIKEGDLVLTHLGRFRRVLKTMNRIVNDEEIVVIPNQSGIDLRITKDHPIYSKKYSPQTKLTQTSARGMMLHDVGWVESGRLTHGNLLYRPIATEERFGGNFPYDEEFFELLGMYIGDGNIAKQMSKNGNIKSLKLRFSLGTDYPELIDRCKFLLSKYSSNKVGVYESKRERCAQVICYDTDLARMIGCLCGYAKRKFVGSDILFAPVRLQKSFVSGWINTDGSVSGRDVTIATAEENLMVDLSFILQRCRILFSISRIPPCECIIRGRTSISRKSYRIHLRNCNESFIQMRTNHRTIYEKDYLVSKVVGISKELYSGEVFNLQVEGDNSYVANGIAVHNCAVGYSDVMGSFIVRNSWGEGFGDKGYCYIPYAYLTNINLSDDFWTIRLINDDDVVKLQSQEKKSWFGRVWESIFGK